MTEKPTFEQKESAKDLARKMGYTPDNVPDVAETIAPFLAVRDAAQAKTIAELRDAFEQVNNLYNALTEKHEAAEANLAAYSSPVSSEDEKSALRFAESSVSPDWGVLFYAYKDLARLLRARTKEVNDLAAWGAKQRYSLKALNDRLPHVVDCDCFPCDALALPIPEAVQAILEKK